MMLAYFQLLWVWCGVELQKFTLLSRKALASEWLGLCYDEAKTEARETWLNEEYINTVVEVYRCIREPYYQLFIFYSIGVLLR
jgi:hypothetical protein